MGESDAAVNVGPRETPEVAEADVPLDSVTLARLLREIRNDAPSEPHAYNRMHNRHNR